MKRFFVFTEEDSFMKEAPAALRETPAAGSGVFYDGDLYTVERVTYDLPAGMIFIYITDKPF
jgi:hypothetical protein